MSERERRRRERFARFMDAYYWGRHADLLALEAATGLYPADVDDYIARHGRPLHFKRYLIGSRGMPR